MLLTSLKIPNQLKLFWVSFFFLFAIACQDSASSVTENNGSETPILLPTLAATPNIELTTPSPILPTQSVDNFTEKSITICLPGKLKTFYLHDNLTPIETAVFATIYESNITTFSYDWQAKGIEQIPTVENGGARLHTVLPEEGSLIVDAQGQVVPLEVGTAVMTPNNVTVIYDGSPIEMNQFVVDFTLKPRVWSDGMPVTAVDSVFSFELAQRSVPEADQHVIERTERYEAIDTYVIRWVGIPGFIDPTYFTNVWQPLPQHAIKDIELSQLTSLSHLPISDGPYKIDDWGQHGELILSKNPFYYRATEGYPIIDKVTFQFIEESNELFAKLLSGSCDIGTSDGNYFFSTANEDQFITRHFITGTIFDQLVFNLEPNRPPWFTDHRVRQAFAHCTDRQFMIDQLLFGASELQHTYLPNTHPLLEGSEIPTYEFDINRGNTLLDEMGFADTDGDGIREYPTTSQNEFAGQPFSIMLHTTQDNELKQQVTQIIKENVRSCGIEVSLFYVPQTELMTLKELGEFDILLSSSPIQMIPNCSAYLTNDAGYSNSAFELSCLSARDSLYGSHEFTKAHQEAAFIFGSDLPVLPLFPRLKIAVTRNDVVGFTLDPTIHSELQNIYMFDLSK